MVFNMSPDRAPLVVRLDSEQFFRAGSRSGPTGRHSSQRKHHCSPPPEKQKIRESRLKIRTTDLQISLTIEFTARRQIFQWIASFAVKVPMVPVHIWLPEAHVEAPKAGSVILAGILFKLGTYGFFRFSIHMFPKWTLCSTPFIYTSSAIAIIYTSSTILRQIDLKKIIAYSSVAHINLVTIGMFSRAADIRSPIFSYGHRQGQNMCAGRATHQPTSNEGENIASSCSKGMVFRILFYYFFCRGLRLGYDFSISVAEYSTQLVRSVETGSQNPSIVAFPAKLHTGHRENTGQEKKTVLPYSLLRMCC
ncbi:hypothetical protein M9H77_23563 [Catharanthus roseus]|uniref:Uncharacterized protein n=1 Tax=Catharanthus roseus TaxID=4058 RepID=A0ACC0ATP6_CATRO|nr:hypothetical protein M9H77_23563 [Catharanthus roseus]